MSLHTTYTSLVEGQVKHKKWNSWIDICLPYIFGIDEAYTFQSQIFLQNFGIPKLNFMY